MLLLIRRLAALSAAWLVPFAAILVLAGCGGSDAPVSAKSSKFKPADSGSTTSADRAVSAGDGEDDIASSLPFSKANGKASTGNADASSDPGGEVPESPFAAKGEAASEPGEPATREGRYPIPKGDTQALVEYFHEMGQQQPQGNSRQEMIADLIEIQESRLSAAKRALSGEMEKQDRRALVQEARSIYVLFMQLGRPKASEQMKAFVDELAKSPQEDTREIGRHQAFQLHVMEIIQEEPEDATEVIAAIKQFIADEKASPDAYDSAAQVCNALQTVAALKAGLPELLTFLGETYKDSSNEVIAARAKGDLDIAKFIEANISEKFEAVIEKKPDADEHFLAALTELATKGQRSDALYQQLKQIAFVLESNLDRHELAVKLLDELVAAYHETKLAESAAKAAAAAKRRVGLIGQPLTVEGVHTDGSPFDWKPFEGKVVLVDFWATWCGPCIEEFPNIVENYRTYKDKGFDVVGVSLDNELAAIDVFFSRQKLPWTIVVSQELYTKKSIDTNKPDTHPLAEHCGIEGIPFVVLIGKDGNVDSIHVRGPKLGKRLAELLGEPANDAKKPASDDKESDNEPVKDAAKNKPSAKPDEDSKTDEPSEPKETEEQGACGAEEPAADAQAAAEEESKVNPYSAKPGLSAADLVKFIDKMLDKPKSIQSRPGFAEALCEACDRLLAADPPAKDADRLLAVETKLETLHKAACGGDASADDRLAAFCEQLKDDPRPRIAAHVAFFSLEHKVLDADKLAPEQIAPLLQDLSDYFAREKLTARHLRLASSTVALINKLEDGQQREKHFASFGAAFAKSSDKELARYGKKLAKKPAAAESDLVGKEMELAGTTAAGGDFDWKKYRGKVVLVDFWATWCGPCIREMPHVRELYDKLHEQGFEIVGVSLDKDAEALSNFLAENEVPWENLAGDDTQELAEKYSVRGIPTMMAVDKDGKILGVAHQVQALVPIIEKALGK